MAATPKGRLTQPRPDGERCQDGPVRNLEEPVRIVADDAGHPGATIEVLSENQNIWPPSTNVTTTTLFSVAHPLLQGGASYWIVTEPSTALSSCLGYLAYQWHTNSTGTSVPYMEDVETGVPVDPWINTPIPVNTAFRVEGDETVDADGAVESPAHSLGSVEPMPFSRSTTLEFALPVAGPVSLVIYDWRASTCERSSAVRWERGLPGGFGTAGTRPATRPLRASSSHTCEPGASTRRTSCCSSDEAGPGAVPSSLRSAARIQNVAPAISDGLNRMRTSGNIELVAGLRDEPAAPHHRSTTARLRSASRVLLHRQTTTFALLVPSAVWARRK